MSTVYPARTVTCFTSMLTGAAPETHGMRSNFVPSLGVKCESVFDVLRRDGMTGRLVGIAHLIDAFGHDDVRTVTAVMHNDEIDDALIAQARRTLLEDDPELLVLQLLSVDQTGHARGSYNDEYLRKIEETDAKIEAFLAWCRERGYLDGATVLVTADHGQGIGIGGHGHMTPPEITHPLHPLGRGRRGRPCHRRDRVHHRHRPDDLRPPRRPGAARVGRAGRCSPIDARRHRARSCSSSRRTTRPRTCPPSWRRSPNPASAPAIAGGGRRLDRRHSRGRPSGRRRRRVARAQPRARGRAAHAGWPPRGASTRAPPSTSTPTASTTPREAHRLLAPIEAGEADYVLGSRSRRGRRE